MTALYVTLGVITFFLASLIVAYVNRRVGHSHRSNPRTERLREAEMEYLTRQNHM